MTTNKQSTPRIALIHATPLAVTPVNEAFATLWPMTELMNLLDDSLSADHAKNKGVLSDAMIQRFIDLAQYAKRTGADAILFTCSAFGPAIEIARDAVGIPTLKPNEAMFEDAISLAAKKTGDIALIATFEPSLAPMANEFDALSKQRSFTKALTNHYVPAAMGALGKGDAETHHNLITDKAATLNNTAIILLAQFSMAAAKPVVEAKLNAIGKSHISVLTSPECAVLSLQRTLQK
jgi:Asp/Glu/hydantoin racemase